MTNSPISAVDRIAYGAVHLDVIALDRSLPFWRDLIGLDELDSPAGEARLGVDGRALIVLHPGAVRPAGRGHAGLYHVAIHLPDEVEFARILARLMVARAPQSPTDHIFSKATYLNDPDGIMLELTLETPERYASIEVGLDSVVLRDSDGRERAGTEPLDIDAALAPLGDREIAGSLPSGTFVGHVHLHVPDLDAAYAFYRGPIGFDAHSLMRPIGMADLGAGGRFPHRIALNDWHGPRARQPEAGTVGLRRFELVVRPEQLAQLREQAAAVDETGAVTIADPAGNTVVVSALPSAP